MIRATTAAVKALVSGVTVYVSRAPAGAALPYVVLHPDQGNPRPNDFEGNSTWRAWRFVTLAVGAGPDQAQYAAEKVEASLLDHRPAVAGWSATPIRKESSVPVDRDEDVQPPVFLTRDVWVFNTVPA